MIRHLRTWVRRLIRLIHAVHGVWDNATAVPCQSIWVGWWCSGRESWGWCLESLARWTTARLPRAIPHAVSALIHYYHFICSALDTSWQPAIRNIHDRFFLDTYLLDIQRFHYLVSLIPLRGHCLMECCPSEQVLEERIWLSQGTKEIARSIWASSFRRVIIIITAGVINQFLDAFWEWQTRWPLPLCVTLKQAGLNLMAC